jgi:hypothetical protein
MFLAEKQDAKLINHDLISLKKAKKHYIPNPKPQKPDIALPSAS